ncbi:putative RNA recognition motif (a k a RRM RBD or RNP domain) [Trypanosoma vivax]|nr:putative RNA recognition motif (a k a RRM RBD or RNP domain) [Trypanosoma vivax]
MSQAQFTSTCDPCNPPVQQLQEIQQQASQQQAQPTQQQQQQQPQPQQSQSTALPSPHQQPQINQEPESTRNLMVNYIPTTVDEVQLRQLFDRFGPIESVKIVCDRESRQSRGYGFVKFQSAASAQQAINSLNGFVILNKRLKVALAANGGQRGRNNANNSFGAYGGYGGYGGYAGYGAYPPAPNPYTPQQMMAMHQQYMMAASPMPPVQLHPSQLQQSMQGGRVARK